MTAREELAAVLLEQLNAEYGDEGWTELGSLRRITDALLASPALARVIRERLRNLAAPDWHVNRGYEYDTTTEAYAAGRNDLIDTIRDQTEETT